MFVGQASQWITDDDLIAEALDALTTTTGPGPYQLDRQAALNAVAKRRQEYKNFEEHRAADIQALHDGDADAENRMMHPPARRSARQA